MMLDKSGKGNQKSTFKPSCPSGWHQSLVSVEWHTCNHRQERFYPSLDETLIYHRVTPSIKFAGTHLYTYVEGGTVWVKYPAQENNTDSVSGQCSNLDNSIQSIRLCISLPLTSYWIIKHMDTYHTIPKATLLTLMIRRQSNVATWYKCTSMEIPIRNWRSST